MYAPEYNLATNPCREPQVHIAVYSIALSKNTLQFESKTGLCMQYCFNNKILICIARLQARNLDKK